MRSKLIFRLAKLDYLILHRKTGTPLELSRKLRISERSARSYVNVLRDLGGPIKFCRHSKTYYYKHEGSFNFRFIQSENSADT